MICPYDEIGRGAWLAPAWPLQRPSGSESRQGHLSPTRYREIQCKSLWLNDQNLSASPSSAVLKRKAWSSPTRRPRSTSSGRRLPHRCHVVSDAAATASRSLACPEFVSGSAASAADTSGRYLGKSRAPKDADDCVGSRSGVLL